MGADGFSDVRTWPNLLAAFRQAAKGKGGHANVAAFEYRLEDNLFQLQDELRHYFLLTQTLYPKTSRATDIIGTKSPMIWIAYQGNRSLAIHFSTDPNAAASRPSH